MINTIKVNIILAFEIQRANITYTQFKICTFEWRNLAAELDIANFRILNFEIQWRPISTGIPWYCTIPYGGFGTGTGIGIGIGTGIGWSSHEHRIEHHEIGSVGEPCAFLDSEARKENFKNQAQNFFFRLPFVSTSKSVNHTSIQISTLSSR